MYQMSIKTNDVNKWVPSSWNFQQSPGMSVWETALDIAERENVMVLSIVDEGGRDVPRGT
jgi:hypothetical protein